MAKKSLGAPASHHRNRLTVMVNAATRAANNANDAISAGKCVVATRRIVEAVKAEGMLRAHYSSLPETQRGSGTDTQRYAERAEERVASVLDKFMDRCVIDKS